MLSLHFFNKIDPVSPSLMQNVGFNAVANAEDTGSRKVVFLCNLCAGLATLQGMVHFLVSFGKILQVKIRVAAVFINKIFESFHLMLDGRLLFAEVC